MKTIPVLLLGIDGGDYTVFESMIKRGLMPNLKRIFEESELARLDGYVEGPGQGWATLMTGQSPKRHGVYYWTVHQGLDSSYFDDSQILWKELNHQGVSTGIINMSYTYPPTPNVGFMISGLGGGLSPGLNAEYIKPAGIMEELKKNGINYIQGVERTVGDKYDNIEMVNKIIEMTEERLATCIYLLENKNPDLFLSVFRGADAIQHSFWRFLEIESPMPSAPMELKRAIQNYYKYLDEVINQLWKRFVPGRRMIISDHGFGIATSIFNVNEFLSDSGFLFKKRNIKSMIGNALFSAIKKRIGSKYRLLSNKVQALQKLNKYRKKLLPKVDVAIDWEKTILYSKDGYGVCLNPKKKINNKDRKLLFESLKAAALPVVNPFSGKKLFKDIYPKKQLEIKRSGNYAPDFVFEYNDESCHASEEIDLGLKPKCFVDLSKYPLYFMSGVHRRYGMLVVDNCGFPGLKNNTRPAITDIYATVMAMFGVEAKNCDGKNLLV